MSVYIEIDFVDKGIDFGFHTYSSNFRNVEEDMLKKCKNGSAIKFERMRKWQF